MSKTPSAAEEIAPSSFPRVPLLTGTDPEDGIRAYLDSAAISALIAEFATGERPPPATTQLAERLAWLDRFSERWDFRAGRERNLVTDGELSPKASALAYAAAEALGLTGRSVPPDGHYEQILILGGLVRACIARPLHCAALLHDGVTADAVTALGGYRPLAGNELPLAESFDMRRHADEFDVMDDGVSKAFSLAKPVDERGEQSNSLGASWRVREYRGPAGLPVSVIAAPSSEPGVRRANTPDTYDWFASKIAKLKAEQRVLVVTTSIYVPFQHVNAIRMFTLPYGVRVDTVGAEPGELDSRLAQHFFPHNYLQEIRSTIRALRDLHTALGST